MRSLSALGDNTREERPRVDAVAAAAALDRFAGDERLGAIFKQMRDIVGVSQSEMARRLGTNVSTLLDFEAGAVAALPVWPETVRIVDRYADLAQVDPSPILTRLLQLQPMPQQASAPRPVVPMRPQRAPAMHSIATDAPSPPPRPQAPVDARPLPPRPQSPPPALIVARQRVAAPVAPRRDVAPQPETIQQPQLAEVPADDLLPAGFDGRSRTRETTVRSARQAAPEITADPNEAAARRRRRRSRTILVVSPILLVVLLFGSMLLAPRPFYRVAKALPGPMAAPLLVLLDTAVEQTATVRDGLRWIELDDPRLRKGDRQSR